MIGTFLGSDETTLFIRGQDGQRYTAPLQQWKETSFPHKGDTLDFALAENNEACSVFFALSPRIGQHTVRTMNMWEIAQHVLRKTFDFRSRATRKEFWYFQLFLIILSLIIMIPEFFQTFVFTHAPYYSSIFDKNTIITMCFSSNMTTRYIFFSLVILPNVALRVRRLHDIGCSGWWIFLPFTIIGAIPLFVMFLLRSSPRPNRWGPSEI